MFIFNIQAIRNNPMRVSVKVFEVFFKSQSAYCDIHFVQKLRRHSRGRLAFGSLLHEKSCKFESWPRRSSLCYVRQVCLCVVQKPTSFLGAVACPVIRLFGQEWDEVVIPVRRTLARVNTCSAIYGQTAELHLFRSGSKRRSDMGNSSQYPVQLCFCSKPLVWLDVS